MDVMRARVMQSVRLNILPHASPRFSRIPKTLEKFRHYFPIDRVFQLSKEPLKTRWNNSASRLRNKR
jgi:hypothetical protein